MKGTMAKFLSSWRPFAIATLIGVSFLTPTVQAAVVIDIYQSGSDVVATGSGTIALPEGATPVIGFGIPATVSELGTILLGFGTDDDQYNGIVLGPDAFGPGGPYYATAGVGPYFGLDGAGNLIVPDGYVSGTYLSSSATWTNLTLSGMGLNIGQYVYTITGTLDTITVNITPVPEPSTFALLGLATLALVLQRRTRSRSLP